MTKLWELGREEEGSEHHKRARPKASLGRNHQAANDEEPDKEVRDLDGLRREPEDRPTKPKNDVRDEREGHDQSEGAIQPIRPQAILDHQAGGGDEEEEGSGEAEGGIMGLHRIRAEEVDADMSDRPDGAEEHREEEARLTAPAGIMFFAQGIKLLAL